MFDTKSDYSLNKNDPDAIVCRSVDGVHIRLTRENFATGVICTITDGPRFSVIKHVIFEEESP